MLKPLFLTLFLTVSLSIIQAQTVEDYFLPESPNNKVNYAIPSSSMTMNRHFTLKDSMIIVQDSSFFQGKYQSTEIKTFHVVNNELHLIRSEFTQGEYTPKIYDFSPAQVVLKIPAQKESVSWTSVDPNQGTINYSASWRVIEKNNETYTLLRVEKSLDYTKIKEVDFYAMKIGLLKTEILTSNGAGLTKVKFDGFSDVIDK